MPFLSVFSREFNRMRSKMYHGTLSANYKQLSAGIKVNFSNRRLDFGQGFYLTSDFKQASEHASKKARRTKYEPIVFVYSIDRAALRDLYTGKILNMMNTAWAEFIYDNRSPMFQKIHKYDYVYGGVADGQNLFDLLDKMDNDKIVKGKADFNFFLNNIARFMYDQLSIHNQSIVDQGYIKLEKVVKAHDESIEYVPA